MFGIDDAFLSAAGAVGGDMFGDLMNSAYSAHLQRDLMSNQSTINRELWRESLLQGPNLQRQGLETAGYNPLLALNGFSVPQMSGVSIPPSFKSGTSSYGSSALEAYRNAKSAKNTEADTDLKKAEEESAKKDVEVKNAQVEQLKTEADLNRARENKAEVQTVTDPLRLAKDVAIGAGSAYGAHKISQKVAEITAHKLPSLTKAQEQLKAEQIRRTKTLKGWNDSLLKRYHKPTQALEALKTFGLFALPVAIGSGTAYGLHKLYESSPKGSNVRKLMDNPIRSPHF